MKTIVISSTKHLIMALTYATLGILAALLIAAVWFLNSRTDLDIWHTIDLSHQFKHHGKVINFKQYLDAENRQFEALEAQIYQATAKLPHQTLNRYFHGSYSDPNKWSQDWNRSFEWPLDDAPLVSCCFTACLTLLMRYLILPTIIKAALMCWGYDCQVMAPFPRGWLI